MLQVTGRSPMTPTWSEVTQSAKDRCSGRNGRTTRARERRWRVREQSQLLRSPRELECSEPTVRGADSRQLRQLTGNGLPWLRPEPDPVLQVVLLRRIAGKRQPSTSRCALSTSGGLRQ